MRFCDRTAKAPRRDRQPAAWRILSRSQSSGHTSSIALLIWPSWSRTYARYSAMCGLPHPEQFIEHRNRFLSVRFPTRNQINTSCDTGNTQTRPPIKTYTLRRPSNRDHRPPSPHPHHAIPHPVARNAEARSRLVLRAPGFPRPPGSPDAASLICSPYAARPRFPNARPWRICGSFPLHSPPHLLCSLQETLHIPRILSCHAKT